MFGGVIDSDVDGAADIEPLLFFRTLLLDLLFDDVRPFRLMLVDLRPVRLDDLRLPSSVLRSSVFGLRWIAARLLRSPFALCFLSGSSSLAGILSTVPAWSCTKRFERSSSAF